MHKPLIKTNPHLRDAKSREDQFINAVITSTAIEGVVISRSDLKGSKKSVKRRK